MASRKQKLKDELVGDPLGRGYSGMADDAEVVASLNAKNRTRPRRVPVPELQKYLFDENIYTDIMDKQGDPDPATDKVARAILALFDSQMTDVDVTRPPFLQGLIKMESIGLITTDQANAIKALGNDSISRAEELGLGVVRVGNIQEAR